MINEKKLVLDGQEILLNNYLLFFYPLQLSRIDGQHQVLDQLEKNNPQICRKVLEELSDQTIVKIPNPTIICNYINDFSEEIQRQTWNPKTIQAIDERKEKFLKKFLPVYSIHMERLYLRVECWNRILRLSAPDYVRTAQERLCAKEAVLLLAMIKSSIPKMEIQECFLDERIALR